MSRVRGIRRFFRIERDGAGVERDVDEELQFHFDMTMRELMANGMNADDALRAAERRFGDVRVARDRIATIDRSRVDRERRAEWWSGFAQDFRYALRSLRLEPAFAIAVILTLGLGIGANATMFGIVDRLLFRPPAFLVAPDRAGKLYIGRIVDGKESVGSYTGYRRYTDYRALTHSLDAMTPFYVRNTAVGTGQATRDMRVAVAGEDIWKMFDVKPVIGRVFTAAEDVPPNGTPVVVLSFAFWQTEFGGRNDALGAKIDIGPFKYTVIGVAPEGFSAFSATPIIGVVPIAAASADMGSPSLKGGWYGTYQMTWFEVYARRRPGVSVQSADADLSTVARQSYLAQVETNPRMTPIGIAKPRAFIGPVLANAGPHASSESKVATWLVGVAAIVLLIACANVANLLLARALKRRREIAVRIALGVSRSRLLMQLMMESIVLALLGGVAGLLIAQWGGAVLRRALLDDAVMPSALADSRVLLFCASLAMLTGILTGLAPSLQAGRSDVATALKAGAREGTVHRSRLRTSLLVAQAALSVVLLIGAGLFLRSLSNVQHLRLGYDSDKLLWIEPNARGLKFDSAQKVSLQRQLMERARTVPGVEHATRALTVPFYMTWQLDLYTAGIDSVNKLGDFTLQAGTPEYFATMGTKIVRGRGITAGDRANAPRVMVVGEAMARKLWPNEDAIGKQVRVGADTMPYSTVVGVAEDVRRGSLSEPDLHYYLSIEQMSATTGGVFVRTSAPAAGESDRIRRELQRIMPGVSYVNVTPMSKIIGSETRAWKLGATMFAVFGALALVLAAVGLYSVIAYNVTQRLHEMGVRVALGAQANDVIRLIVREALTIVLPGILLGTLIALLAGHWVAPLLFQVSPKDPPVMVSVIVTLVAVAVAASWLPALRAARVDPNEALRAD